jgi:primase-polymerase (primpol)-like protein
MTVNGYWASSTDATTWSDYQTAKASKHGDGLGFVLNGDGIICIDLDHCVTNVNGKIFLSTGAQVIVDSMADSYVEISPSGTGLHIWGRANLDKGHRFTYMNQSVEIYPNGRFLTMTGNVYRNGGLPELNLNHLLAETATVNA